MCFINYICELTDDSSSKYGGVGSIEANGTAENRGGRRGRAIPTEDTQSSLQQVRLH